ncbi:MAG: hypothetical protein ABI443_11615, partial [Chthoniobacterales bacterium]
MSEQRQKYPVILRVGHALIMLWFVCVFLLIVSAGFASRFPLPETIYGPCITLDVGGILLAGAGVFLIALIFPVLHFDWVSRHRKGSII